MGRLWVSPGLLLQLPKGKSGKMTSLDTRKSAWLLTRKSSILLRGAGESVAFHPQQARLASVCGPPSTAFQKTENRRCLQGHLSPRGCVISLLLWFSKSKWDTSSPHPRNGELAPPLEWGEAVWELSFRPHWKESWPYLKSTSNPLW